MKSVSISNKDRDRITTNALEEWRKGVGKTLNQQEDNLREQISRAGPIEYERLYPKPLQEDMKKFYDTYGAGFEEDRSFKVFDPVTSETLRLDLNGTELFPVQHENREFIEQHHRCSDELSKLTASFRDTRKEYREKMNEFEVKIRNLLDSVSTTGKLLKAWPAAEHLFPESLNQKIRNAEQRVNSPRPKPQTPEINTDDLTAVLVTARMSE